ncbi:MAG: hypothetical protein ACM34O_07020 [Ignavibacteria bacterium]
MRYTAIFFIALLVFNTTYPLDKNSSVEISGDKEITDETFRFTFLLPDDWQKTDMKFTSNNDAISYSFERKDKKCAIMLLAFKLTTVKNLEDFIYTMEKDISLNIPQRDGDYTASDAETFDGKSAKYKDTQFLEYIYYFRTKLPDAPFNYIYMMRFITTGANFSTDLENQIKKISNSFLPTAK